MSFSARPVTAGSHYLWQWDQFNTIMSNCSICIAQFLITWVYNLSFNTLLLAESRRKQYIIRKTIKSDLCKSLSYIFLLHEYELETAGRVWSVILVWKLSHRWPACKLCHLLRMPSSSRFSFSALSGKECGLFNCWLIVLSLIFMLVLF